MIIPRKRFLRSTRRGLLATAITGAGTLLSLPLQAVTSSKSLAIMFMAGGGGGGGTSGSFPGQTGNPVGYAAAPGYPGSLTPHGTTGWVNGNTYSFLDVDAGTGGTNFTGLNNVTWIGCRFQSNSTANYCTNIGTGANLNFQYCSFTPRTALYTTPPGAAWPSAGAGLQTTTQVTNTNCIDGNSGHQYGMVMGTGPLTLDHCDFWGFGNGGPLWGSNTTQQINVTDTWIHDPANASPQSYHIDGTGYVNGGTPPQNILFRHCTITAIGNTNAAAWQAATSGYNNIIHDQCFFSGFGYCVDMCHNAAGNTNLTFTNNVFGTDLPWIFGALYANFTAQFSQPGFTWSGNKLRILAGTSALPGTSPAWTSGDDGKFIWPDSTLNVTDF